MCGEVKEQSFLEAVHEMGHIQYYMAYHKLPMIYRNGANSAFHEAVGETMVYAVQSPECLQLLNIGKPSEISRGEYFLFLHSRVLEIFFKDKFHLLFFFNSIQRFLIMQMETNEKVSFTKKEISFVVLGFNNEQCLILFLTNNYICLLFFIE